jgi:hypothetical protein
MGVCLCADENRPGQLHDLFGRRDAVSDSSLFLVTVVAGKCVGLPNRRTSPIPGIGFAGFHLFPNAIDYLWWSKAFFVAAKTSDVTNFMFITPLLAALMGFVMI